MENIPGHPPERAYLHKCEMSLIAPSKEEGSSSFMLVIIGPALLGHRSQIAHTWSLKEAELEKIGLCDTIPPPHEHMHSIYTSSFTWCQPVVKWTN